MSLDGIEKHKPLSPLSEDAFNDVVKIGKNPKASNSKAKRNLPPNFWSNDELSTYFVEWKTRYAPFLRGLPNPLGPMNTKLYKERMVDFSASVGTPDIKSFIKKYHDSTATMGFTDFKSFLLDNIYVV